MKIVGYFFFAVITLLLTFFGLGPVVFADGVASERILTFLVVLLGYIIIAFLFIKWRRKSR